MARRTPRTIGTLQGRESADKSTQHGVTDTGAESRAAQFRWFVLAAAIPLVLCTNKLNHDVWFDESYTISTFASQSFINIATTYPEPNNHVLYSLLLRPFYLMSHHEYVLRLPSLLCTAGTLLFAFRLGLRFGGATTGTLATLALGLNQMFLIHTMQIRGYALSMFLAAWLGDLAFRCDSERTRKRLAAIAMVGAALLYVLPSNVLFLAPLSAAAVGWTAWQTRNSKFVYLETAAWCFAGLLGVLCYAPIWRQVMAHAGSQRSTLQDSVDLAWQFFSSATRDAWPWLPVPLAAGAMCWVVRMRRPTESSRTASVSSSRPNDLALFILLLAMLAGPFVSTFMLHVKPFVRNYCPALPFVALLQARLVSELWFAILRLIPALRNKTEVNALAAGLGAVLLAGVFLPRLLSYPARLAAYRDKQLPEDGYYVYYAAEFRPSQVVEYLVSSIAADEYYLLCFTDEEQSQLGYYLTVTGLPYRRTKENATQGTLAVVYVIATRHPDYEALSQQCGLPPDIIREFQIVSDSGYYQVRCSNGPQWVRLPR